MGFHYIKSIYLCRHTGKDTGVKDTAVKEGNHHETGKGIELEIMVREPVVEKS